MVTRRRFLSGVATVGAAASLSGCFGPNVKGNFKMIEIGLVEKGTDVAAFIEIENISSEERVFVGWLATYNSENVRVSDWYKIEDSVEPGTRRRLYVVFESGDSGWADSNDIGQVVDSHTAKFRHHNANEYGPEGKPYGENSEGSVL